MSKPMALSCWAWRTRRPGADEWSDWNFTAKEPEIDGRFDWQVALMTTGRVREIPASEEYDFEKARRELGR